MNINAERFFALTALLAAPLVSASACVINDSDDDGTGSNTNANTDSTNPSTTTPATDSTTEPSTTTPGTDSMTVGTGDTTGDDPTGGTTDDPTGDTSDSATTGGVDLGNCCMPDGATAGCEVPEVQDCVCESDAYCCDELWDQSCAAEVNSLGCGVCEFPPMALDCYCIATCDDQPVAGPWQVCGSDPVAAAADGQAACEDELTMLGCAGFSCDECDCAAAEVPEIDCGK